MASAQKGENMKNWLKKQATEITAWTGFSLLLGAFFAPRWVFIVLGIALIASDDEKAKAWVASKAPVIGRWIDEWSKP